MSGRLCTSSLVYIPPGLLQSKVNYLVLGSVLDHGVNEVRYANIREQMFSKAIHPSPLQGQDRGSLNMASTYEALRDETSRPSRTCTDSCLRKTCRAEIVHGSNNKRTDLVKGNAPTGLFENSPSLPLVQGKEDQGSKVVSVYPDPTADKVNSSVRASQDRVMLAAKVVGIVISTSS